MNNAKMWLVVKPTVGIPLFLSAVAIGSFAVHVAVLTNTGWVSDFLKGQELGTTAALSPTIDTAEAGAKIYFDHANSGAAQTATVVLPDGRSADVVFKAPLTTAAVDRVDSGGTLKPAE